MGGAFRSVSVSHSVSSVLGGWARGFPSGMSPVPRPLGCPGVGDGDIGCGSNLLDRLALAGLLETRMWTPTPVPLAGTDRPVGSLRPWLLELGLSRSLSPLTGDGWLESPRSVDVSGTARPPFSGAQFLAVLAPRDGALGIRWRSGSLGVLSFPCSARRSLTVRDPHSVRITGRLQGLVPPTSPG